MATYTPSANARKPWSSAAIAGFVLSLLGCVGITAILGFIFGIIGIVNTKDGQRRGLGLAVAAIPISLITAVLSVLLGLGIITALSLGPLFAELADALESPEPVDAVAVVRSICSESFNEEVDDGALQAWLARIRNTHGNFVELQPSTTTPTKTPEGGIRFTHTVKFVNGNASITVELIRDGLVSFKIADFAVDGVSPRPAD
jgi:hypothetical protein